MRMEYAVPIQSYPLPEVWQAKTVLVGYIDIKSMTFWAEEERHWHYVRGLLRVQVVCEFDRGHLLIYLHDVLEGFAYDVSVLVNGMAFRVAPYKVINKSMNAKGRVPKSIIWMSDSISTSFIGRMGDAIRKGDIVLVFNCNV